MIARAAALAALVAGAVVAVVVLTGGTEGHKLVVLADDARFLNEGAQVRLAGQPVGVVKEAEATREGKARLVLRITEANAWPLPTGTQADFRWASTIAFSNRYVSLVPPREAGNGTVPEGGTIPPSDVTRTVEIDRVVSDFDRPARRNLRATIDASGRALDKAKGALQDTLDAAPPAVAEADAVFADLSAGDAELRQLIGSADTVVHAIRASDPDTGRLLTGAATTFDALSDRATQLERVLEQMPATLDAARETLATADGTLQRADDVTQRLAPGVAEVRRLAAPLNATLSTLVDVGPDARATLASLRRAAPQLNPLVDRLRTLMPSIKGVGVQGDKAVNCIRPYAPEIGNFGVVWGAFNNTGDDKDRWFRAKGVAYPVPVASPLSPKQVTDLMPQLDYGFPRPPGFVANQPWFQPQCNLGPETLDPAKDPEALG
jgi:phospholipid/cholesterol/gamma-HCH transport system substrate-binding protein